VPYKNCAYVFTYSADADTIYIELFGQVLGAQNTFLAVGFSHDNEMVKKLQGDLKKGLRPLKGLSLRLRLKD
jgi:hypothetical protein